MLRQLTIQNRSPAELRQLAAARRQLASTTKVGRIRDLLLNEGKLLDYQAELRAWIEHPDRLLEGRRARQVPLDSVQFLPDFSLSMTLPLVEREALFSAASALKYAEKDTSLAQQDGAALELLILCSGMAKAIRTLEDGTQQITSVFVAGDTMNAADMALGSARSAVLSLSPVVYLSIGRKDLDHLMLEHAGIARAIWQETAAQAAIQQEWAISLGRRMAQRRLAHFLCEISFRLGQSEGSESVAMDFLLCQRDLADVLGLSVVHINRSLQKMRRSGLIDLRQKKLTIKNKDGLYKLGDFEPGYLRQSSNPGGGASQSFFRVENSSRR
jgi:CRP-like cAMP-binding protein